MHAIDFDEFPILQSKKDDEELVELSIYILERVENGLHYLPNTMHVNQALGGIRLAIKQLGMVVVS